MAAISTSAASEDNSTVSWWDPNPAWGETLSRMNVLTYFSNSPFFDHNSNNAKAVRQGLDHNFIGHLEKMGPGVEFVLHLAQEPWLFVIRKQQRISAKEQQHQAYYCVIDKQVTQAASLHSILSARLQRCLGNIKTSFALMHQDLSPLQQLVKAHEKHEKQEKQQQVKQEAGNASAPPAIVQQQQEQQDQQQVQAGAAGSKAGATASKAVAPIPVRKPPTKEEVDRLSRTDHIIMRVLSTYSHAGMAPGGVQQPTASALPPASAATGAAGGSQMQGGVRAAAAGAAVAPAASQGGSEVSEPAAKRARR